MKYFQAIITALALVATLVSASNEGHQHQHRHTHGHRQMNSARQATSQQQRYVFAHFMVGIVSNRQSAADWDADMIRAKAYGIDAFALNIGTDYFTDTQVQYAYQSAQNNGMKIFLSFDFNWWSLGSATQVGQKIAQYAKSPAQLLVDGKVFVSTFVGDGVDVNTIRNTAGSSIYFAPNFHPSYGTDFSTSDGGFNWMAWPNNGNNRAPSPGQNGTVEAGDQQYIKALGSKDYIAPVSPWFFTHYGSEVSYSKNWMFPGEDLWYTRWQQVLTMGPRFVEIISWNDYGESHYVGPLSSPHLDDGASKWCNDMPHNAWLEMAKPYIAAYKARATSVSSSITSDQLIYWYRPQLMNTDCDATDTCMASSSNPDYYVGRPNGWQTVSDKVFVVALLQSAGTVTVNSGSNKQVFNAPAGASIYTVSMGVGKQNFTLTRGSGTRAQTVFSGTSLKDIISGCVCGLYNFNAYVGSVPASINDALQSDGLSKFTQGLKVSSCSATPSLGLANDTATSTSSVSTATSLSSSSLSFLVSSSLSPSSSKASTMSISTTTTTPSTTAPATTSTKSSSTTTPSTTASTITSIKSSSITTPSTTTSTTVSTKSSSTTTPSTTASTTTSIKSSSTTTSSSASATATTCNAGTGSNNYIGLCQFCCSYGYCPPGPCTCTSYGAPNTPLPERGVNGVPADGLDSSYAGLCSYACNHGYCPSTACKIK